MDTRLNPISGLFAKVVYVNGPSHFPGCVFYLALTAHIAARVSQKFSVTPLVNGSYRLLEDFKGRESCNHIYRENQIHRLTHHLHHCFRILRKILRCGSDSHYQQSVFLFRFLK